MNPMLLLDYRCYTPGGRINSSYPAQTVKCLQKLSSSNVTAIQAEYGFPSEENANALQQRAAGEVAYIATKAATAWFLVLHVHVYSTFYLHIQ